MLARMADNSGSSKEIADTGRPQPRSAEILSEGGERPQLLNAAAQTPASQRLLMTKSSRTA